MIRTKQEAKYNFRKIISHQHYMHKCEYCGEELIMEHNDIEKVLFEPREVKQECIKFSKDGEIYRKENCVLKESSDTSKDIARFICPVCGKTIEVNYNDFLSHTCGADGEQHMIFVLEESETNAARDFIKKHNHADEFAKENKLCFSALGQQFTYMITPGGLVVCNAIKCNKCGETEDLTNIENW